ncbi:hypothetical protein [uncultured Methanoregula sp.]|uniref:hypothetical protein n=1 Tax=uncultured Methanoregula sp. TaxID=1005933 RepID=UPI002AAB2F3B|nr:hypothetical protein [uncultured Methanoregula sp.]
MGDYFDVSTFSVADYNLGAWLHSELTNLSEMIASGDVYKVMGCQDHQEYDGIYQTFIKTNKPKIILRTRNFKNKAVVHNSKIEILKPVVEHLLEKGYFIFNIGTPTMPLSIKNDDYHEVNHNMAIEDEFKLCSLAQACMLSTEAGLFIAFAATDLTLIQYDDDLNIKCHNVDLFGARRKAGLNDIDIRNEIFNNDFEGAADVISRNVEKKSNTRDDWHFQPEITRVEL